MKAQLKLCGILIALVLIAASCSSSPSSGGSGGPKQGGELRFGSSSQIDSLNPFVAFQQDAYTIFGYEYPFLMQYDTTTLQFKPYFATSWSHSSDGLTWTFHTRPGAKWSDGQPLTAKDAAFSINMVVKYQKTATSCCAGYVANVKNAKATDDNTLVVNYSKPSGEVLPNLQQMPIVPQHVWGKLATGNGSQIKKFANAPTGNKPVVSGGPFMLVSYKKKDVALFQRNPNFWGTKPHIDGWGLQYYSNDDAMISALKNGEIDAAESVPPTALNTLKSSGITVSSVPGLELRDFIINSNPKKPNNRELLNPLVKQAFDYAIDRKKIASTAWLGTAQPGSSIIPPTTGDAPGTSIPWSDPKIQPPPFSLSKANQLLDQAGYKKGPDGIRVANGHKMQYTVIFAHDEAGAGDRSFSIIQSDFQQIGVKLIQRSLDDTTAYDQILAPNGKYLNFDLAMWDWVPLIDPDFMLYILTCNSWGIWNDSGYCNKKYDRLYKKQGQTVDPAKRAKIVYQMEQMIAKDKPYLIYAYNQSIDAYTKNWTGFVKSPQGILNPLSTQTLVQVHRV
ncbi:MAG: peptide/nickel transport system substrate-binding protein [Actinomycetota bacterium]|jgi:peptide/nickel transport system substrate-binding protein|nr:peptide/nickel transport system substrate-binding protein [Actinomycetota bacterium]